MGILRSLFQDLTQLRSDAKSLERKESNELLRIFVGYDPRQPVAYNVLQQSLLLRSSQPLAITPLVLQTLPIQRQGLTPFTYSRFLVPWICDYDGWGLFLDLDMLALGDISEIFDAADPRYGVMVTKSSQRFEWASSILFNCSHPANRILTPDYVDDPERCRMPHMMDWLDDALVGSLPLEWNHTVGYDRKRGDAKLVHFTQGVPCHSETRDCEYTEEWFEEFNRLGATNSWTDLMGNSVHAKVLPDGRIVPKLTADSIQAAQVDQAPTPTDSASEQYSRASPSPRYLQLVSLYRDMHQHGDRLNKIPPEETFDGRSLVPHLETVSKLCKTFGAKSLLDYGCGKGGLYRQSFTLQDGREISSLKEFWGVEELRLYDPGFEPYVDLPSDKFDGVICTDVLEHCPEEDLYWIIRELFGFAKFFLFCTISCRPAIKKLPTGENAHITINPPGWWKAKLSEISRDYPKVKYLSVCYGADETPEIFEG